MYNNYPIAIFKQSNSAAINSTLVAYNTDIPRGVCMCAVYAQGHLNTEPHYPDTIQNKYHTLGLQHQHKGLLSDLHGQQGTLDKKGCKKLTFELGSAVSVLTLTLRAVKSKKILQDLFVSLDCRLPLRRQRKGVSVTSRKLCWQIAR